MAFPRFIKRELKELLSRSIFGQAYRALGIKAQLELCQFVAQEQSELSVEELLEKYLLSAVLEIRSIHGLKDVVLSDQEVRGVYELLSGGPGQDQDLGEVVQAVSLEQFFAALARYTQGDACFRSRHRIYLIFDDTLLRKTGKQMAHIHHLFDTCHRCYVLGYHSVVLYVVIGPKASEEFVLQHDVPLYPQPRPKGYQSPTDKYGLAIGFLKWLHQRTTERHLDLCDAIVLFDRWYLGSRMTQACAALGMTWVAQSKSTFVYYVQGERFTASELIECVLRNGKLKVCDLGRSRYTYYTVVARSPTFGRVRLVVWYREHSQAKTETRKCKLLVCNNITTRFNAIKTIRAYRVRWRVEVMFRTAKQLCRLAHFHQTDAAAIINSLSVAYLTFNVFSHAWHTYGKRAGAQTIGQMAKQLKYALLKAA